MSQERQIDLTPFLLSYLKDYKPTKRIEKFVAERFLDICHEACSQDGNFSSQDFGRLTAHPYYKIKEWKDEPDNPHVLLVQYTPFEMLQMPVVSTSEKILSLLASVPPMAAKRIVNRVEEYIQTEVFS